jgi:FMN phosphatase YigB (HAD superfamily)
VIKVVMFDLGGTLIDAQGKPFAHVKDALATIAAFKTTGSRLVHTCLVSDFTMPVPPVTAEKVRALFQQYVGLLDQTGLRPFFEPVQKHVTLSTNAGKMKPHRAVFAKALSRLGVTAGLAESMLITEDAAHVAHVRDRLHMRALRFAPDGAGDFEDWAEAPSLVAAAISPANHANAVAALKTRLAASGMELVDAQEADAGQMKVSAKAWHPIKVPGRADLGDVHVAIPVEGVVKRNAAGHVSSTIASPSAEQIDEATSFVSGLAAHDQIASGSPNAPKGATHEIEVAADGKQRLVRRRFSAM